MQSSFSNLNPLLIGGGTISTSKRGDLRLRMPIAPHGYVNAQLDDYTKLPRSSFHWTPPVRFHLRARASHPAPYGTLGFGFWNDPFTFSLGQGGAARRLPAAPSTLWFFYGSQPNDLSFSNGVPGSGWKASSMQTPHIPSLLLAPLAAGAIILSKLPGLRAPVLQIARSMAKATEAQITVPLNEWHNYSIDWNPYEVIFKVDDNLLLVAPDPHPGPLGFVAWIDNQYAFASPEKGFGFGVIPTHEPQWLELTDLTIETY